MMTDKNRESETELVLSLKFLTLEHMASQEICDRIQIVYHEDYHSYAMVKYWAPNFHWEKSSVKDEP